MIKLLKLSLKSKTVWTVVFMFILSGSQGIQEQLGVVYEPLMAVLSATAIVFRLNPSQKYGGK